LTTREECEAWLTADWKEAKKLQGPLADGQMMALPQYIDVGGFGCHPAKPGNLFTAT
jgi:putative SOS response-associated peptidase YedK